MCVNDLHLIKATGMRNGLQLHAHTHTQGRRRVSEIILMNNLDHFFFFGWAAPADGDSLCGVGWVTQVLRCPLPLGVRTAPTERPSNLVILFTV